MLGRLFGYILLVLLLIAAPGLHAQESTVEPTAEVPHVVYPYLSIMFQSDFQTMPAVEADEGWEIVKQNEEYLFCNNNYAASHGMFPVFLFGNDDWQDYSLEVQVQLTAREAGHMAILSRLDPNRWGYRHRLFFDFWGQGFAQYYYGGEEGTTTQGIGQYNRTIDSGWWYVIRAEVESNTVRTMINGTAISDYNADFNDHGRAGIEVGPGARLCLDDLIVRSLDRTDTRMADLQRAVANRNSNVRLLPGLTYSRVGILGTGEPLFVLGWNSDKTWVQVRKVRGFVQGWVWAENLDMVLPPTPDPVID